MKKHKIRNIDINVCCCEQKITYNYLFAHYKHNKEKSLDFIKNDLSIREDMKKYNIELIYSLIEKYFDFYNNNFFIATSYQEIGNKLIIDF